MSDPNPTAPGRTAPSGSAATPPSAPSVDAVDAPARKRNPIARIVLASAAGTTSPLHRSNYAVATNRGYGEAMGRGFELALTLVVMGGLGWGVDQLVGTYPLFVVIFAILGFAGITVKLFIGYDLEMRQHEDGAIWNRGKTPRGRDAAGNGRTPSGPETTAT
jgi:F0F1-type ATP synthase assembly protein I